jgi:uncharacterized protein
MANNRKIFNDPIYGFITIPSDFILELIEHPYFQRLRRIKQLGLTELVYPGATHSRFHHALGAMYLMNQALDVLQAKGILIMEVEREAAMAAILLHDLGHGPFSHVLEYTILKNVHHEDVSLLLMEKLNAHFKGRLELAIDIFKGNYERSFFHELISSQLDMDRLDYLNRDSFYTGVVEGKIGAERIIKMLNVADNQLVIEEKGILTVENYLFARRLMYWQVYLHKTALCVEAMLVRFFERIKHLLEKGIKVELPENLLFFQKNNISFEELRNNSAILEHFIQLDDSDIWLGIKKMQFHEDRILSKLASGVINRKLFKIKIEEDLDVILTKEKLLKNKNFKNVSEEDLKYLFFEGQLSQSGYERADSNIKILMKNNIILDFSDKSDKATVLALSNVIKKNYLCYAQDMY